MLIEQKGRQGVYNDMWHTDVTYQQAPPMGSILHAQILPPQGGDTLWASMYAAYDALSDRMKTFLDGMTALHDFGYSYSGYLLDKPEGRKRLREIEDQYPTVEHPVIRTHPETGRKALFVNSAFTTRLLGVSTEESEHLLKFLYAHAVRPDFVYRHRWRVGDVVMFDNRCLQHYVVPDHPHNMHRRMHRTTASGDRPF